MASRIFLVGTGVESIYACCLTADGQLELIHENKCGQGSTWLFRRQDLLYVVNEHSNQIETFTIEDQQQGKLTLKNTISSIGYTPCSFDIDPSGKWLGVAKYTLSSCSACQLNNFFLFWFLVMVMRAHRMSFSFH